MQRNAIVVGSGPNGLAAAIVLAQAGFEVEVREAAGTAGGAARSEELTLPGFTHDVGAAVHPMALTSPFFRKLPLEQHGLKWIWPAAALAHPLDDGTAVLLEREMAATTAQLGKDARTYRRLVEPLAENWDALVEDVLRPLGWPKRPWLMARFGLPGFFPCSLLTRALFTEKRTRALFAGLSAHSNLELEAPLSSAFGLMLGAAAHAVGWPIVEGGSQNLMRGLTKLLSTLNGRIVTNQRVMSLAETSTAALTLCDVTPRQFLKLAEGRLTPAYRASLGRYRYGPAVFKMDWALKEPIPWKAAACGRAATVHLGASLEEIAASERAVWHGRVEERPFVILVQPSLFDATRAPAGLHTAWAYCHVPNGWPHSAAELIERQIERFAPGFRDCILARAAHTPAALNAWNENLVGGDIIGGAATLAQFLWRPTWRQYTTSVEGVYLCSSSTPPGGGVHGMCGYWAAQRALDWLGRRGGK
jgi:phytoene dehydrogenase-like protein